MSNPHVLVIPFPAQGHVNPLMQFSQSLANHGCKVTFVNTDFTHQRIMCSMAKSGSLNDAQIHMVSIPDGMGPEDDRNGVGKLFGTILNTMPAKLEVLIKDINSSEGENPITCVVADWNMGWAVEVADKMGIRGAVLWPASAAVLALIVSIPKLIDDGIIDCDGFPSKKQIIKLSPSMPAMDTVDFPWYSTSESATDKKTFFNYVARYINYLQLANWCLGNTFHELEPGTFSLLPVAGEIRTVVVADLHRRE